METAILVLHILVGILVILMVMIQGGENVDITAAFGGVSQAAFGPRGTVSTLAKSTWVLGAIFMATSITLSVWASQSRSGSVLENTTKQSAPAKTPARAPVKPPPLPTNPFQK
ncbi:MAG: preprotein translocase subunit SecG [Terriglobia bacterium]